MLNVKEYLKFRRAMERMANLYEPPYVMNKAYLDAVDLLKKEESDQENSSMLMEEALVCRRRLGDAMLYSNPCTRRLLVNKTMQRMIRAWENEEASGN